MPSTAETLFTDLVQLLSAVLFAPVFGFPLIVMWAVAAGVFFTLRLGFVNLRLFRHAVDIVSGKFSHPDDPGDVSHFQALSTALSGTVGLGNIAGVAVAVAAGGPGAVIWMVIAGFFAMSLKFSEVFLGQKYRTFDEQGRVSGGAFHYLEDGLKERALPRLGKMLAILFAVLCIIGSFGGGNMFQSNQVVKVITQTFSPLEHADVVVAGVLTFMVAIVLLGGIRRIAHVAEKIVPLMAVLYLGSGVLVLFVNSDKIPEALSTMFTAAFSWDSAWGGMLGAMIMGCRRAYFSNEAGIGSAPIAHAAAQTREPVREACVALLEPFIDTIIICFMTGLVITVSGVYVDTPFKEDGVLLTSEAFATVSEHFRIMLAICVSLFAFSTMISWSYYGERAWHYLFGAQYIKIFYILFLTAGFLGSLIPFGVVVDFSDLMLLSMAFPNILGLYLMQGLIAREAKEYTRRLKAGEFKITPSPLAGRAGEE